MSDESQTTPSAFNCEGGLVLNKSNFMMQPGEALELKNFEPAVGGGYRRINGYTKYVLAIVPYTASASEKVLMVATFGDNVLAARGTSIYSSASTHLATAIASSTGMTGSGTITVDSTVGFSSSGTVQLGSETFTYTGKTSTAFTGVTRATGATSAAAHALDAVLSEAWNSIDSGRTSANKYNFERFNFDGTDKIIVVDGANAPTVFNSSLAATDIAVASAGTGEQTLLAAVIASGDGMTGSGTLTVADTSQFASTGSVIIGTEIFTYTGKTSTTFTGVTRAVTSSAIAHEVGAIVADLKPSAVTGAKHVAAFKNHMFFAGMSANKQEVVFSAPFQEGAFSVAIGAGSFKVDDEITGIKVFRDNLFIFCETRIFKLSGSSGANFTVSDVTRDIGCINGDTIQEFAGDLIFLGPDGLRTVAGTARIGDVELGTISSSVQSIFNDNIADASEFESVVITDKTQYRIFFTKSTVGQNQTKGIICVLKGQKFEFSEIVGIRPSCTDSFVSEGNVIVLHGAYAAGYIYKQESGNTFDGTSILGRYRSPDLTFNDPGIRKHMQRVIVNYNPEAAVDADLFVRYDYEDKDSPRPAAYPLDSTDVVAIYGTSVYGTPTYGGSSQPLVRQSVEGSGFAVALRVNDGGATAPYALKGFQLEYQLGARR
jgi:hypothetical protein